MIFVLKEEHRKDLYYDVVGSWKCPQKTKTLLLLLMKIIVTVHSLRSSPYQDLDRLEYPLPSNSFVLLYDCIPPDVLSSKQYLVLIIVSCRPRTGFMMIFRCVTVTD